VVVLAGDIDNGTRAIDWAEQAFAGRPVLYVPGNHEFYDAEYVAAGQVLKARAAQSPNVRVLDNDEVVLDGVRFLGSTLWTDFELFGAERAALAMNESLKYVVDFRAIRHGTDGLLTPEQTVVMHHKAVAFLERQLAVPFPGKTVVITHHAPHPGSVHPRWAKNLTSAAFVSDLTRLLGRASLWMHGHTHDSFDYEVLGTRVVANPMGYRSSNWKQAKTGALPPQVTFENVRFDAGLTLTI
jgi:Icc-related predicted phosphoesterase